jgi:preprotein translocase subunit YajC
MLSLLNAFASLDLTARLIYMSLLDLNPLLALGTAPQPGQPGPPPWMQMVPLALLVVVFYFALIRPQQKKAKEQAEMLKSVRAGDKIVTNGGIIATVVTVKEKSISIRSADAKFEIIKSGIAQITERSGEASES